MGKELQDCREELFEANNKKSTFYEELLHERQDNKDKDIEIRDLRAGKPTMEQVMLQKELDKCRRTLTALQTELMGTKATLSLKPPRLNNINRIHWKPPLQMVCWRLVLKSWSSRSMTRLPTTISSALG